MKIEYVWHDEPNRKKLYDTEKSFKMNHNPFSSLDAGKTQEKFDKHELESFEEKKNRGLVLEYKVIQ